MKQHVCLPYSHCVSLYLIMCNWTCAFFKIMLSQNMIHEYMEQEHLIFYVTMYVPRCKTKLQSSLTLLLKLKCFLPLLFIFTNNRVENLFCYYWSWFYISMIFINQMHARHMFKNGFFGNYVRSYICQRLRYDTAFWPFRPLDFKRS